MKIALRFIALIFFALACHPASAGCLQLLNIGKCSASGPPPLNTPTIVPQPSAFFTQSNNSAGNVGLKPASGAFSLPSADAQSSWSMWTETLANPQSTANVNWILGGTGLQTNGLFVGANAAQILSFQVQSPGISGNQTGNWWLPTGAANALTGGLSASKATNGFLGYYAWTGDTSGANAACQTGAGARPPSGILNQTTSGGSTADPGFLCSVSGGVGGAVATMASIGGLGYAQTASITGCTSNSPISGKFTITLTTPAAHGIEQGASFSLNSSATTGFNTNYLATAAGPPGTLPQTLTGVGATTGTCPASSGFPISATTGAGTAGSISYSAPATNAFQQNETTGIQLAPNQRSCLLIGENGDETNFPGSQFAYATRWDGTLLPGATTPVLSPWLNMGAVNFQGYMSSGTQSTGPTPALTVTSMTSFAITNAVKATGQLYDVTFTVGANNPFVIGSEFTVAGVTNSGTGSFNGTYVAVSPTPINTPGTTVYGKLLTGSVGVPTAFTGSPTFSGAGTVVGVIMPGMQVLGASGYAQISPYGQYGGTGTGGTGTYGMTGTQSSVATTGTISDGSGGGGNILSVTASPAGSRIITVGTLVSASGYTGTVISFGTGTGATGTYNLSASSGALISSGITIGPLGISATTTSVNIYAASGFYYTIANNTAGALPGGKVTTRTASSVGDLITVIGSKASTSTGGGAAGWGGSIGNVGMYQGVFPATNGSPSTSAFNSLCQKTTDFQDFATANSGKWNSLHRLNDPGEWADSSQASFTGHVSTNQLTIDSVQYPTGGTLPSVTAGVPSIKIAGAGLCVSGNACPTITSGSAGGPYTLSASFGTISSEAMTAGNFSPATPILSLPLTGSITGSTLTVTNVAPAATPWVGTGVSFQTGTNTTLNYTTSSGALAAGQCLIDSLGLISPSAPLCASGIPTSTTSAVQSNYFPRSFAFTGDTLYAYQTRVVPGQFIVDTAGSITTPAQVTGQLTQAACASGTPVPIPATVSGECGTYALSTSANGTVGSEQMYMSGVGTAGAIAPGPALAIDNPGLGVIYPVVVGATPLLGTMPIKGTYDVATLGGTPTHIQAQVSATPGGPPISGCSACAWTNVSSETISGGNWSGSVVSIPAGSPYWISVRASNGIGYVTMPNSVGVGINYATFGEGNTGWLFNTDNDVSFMSGLGQTVGFSPGAVTGGLSAVFGPPVINNLTPFAPAQTSIDAYSATSFLGEGNSSIIQTVDQVLGGAGITVPTGAVNMSRNGVPFVTAWWDNQPQTQMIGIGDGSSTVFSSGAGFGGTVGGSMTSAVHNGTGATIATGTGQLTITAVGDPIDNWLALAQGDTICVPNCTSPTYSGTIVAAAPTVSTTGIVLDGWGGAGHYIVAPPPGSTQTAVAYEFKHNVLGFNASLLYGASFTGSVSGTTLTVSSVNGGAETLDPTEVVSDGTHTATLVACLTLCTQSIPNSSTWKISNNTGLVNGPMFAQAAGGSPMVGIAPNFMSPGGVIQTPASAPGNRAELIKLGSFQILKNGTPVCTDAATTFSWQLGTGQCTDSGGGVVVSANSWVNYQNGTYSIAFTSAPSTSDVITAQWNNCSTMNNDEALNNICWVGSGKNQDGVYSTLAAKTGGINAWIDAQQIAIFGLDEVLYTAKNKNPTFATNFARLHNGQANQPVYTSGMTRWVGPATSYPFQQSQGYEMYFSDSAVPSTFSGSISNQATVTGGFTAVLTLSTAVTGSIWEGEMIECAPASIACSSTALAAGQGIPALTEIVGLCTTALCGTPSPQPFGTSGSTYAIANSGTVAFVNTIGSAFAMENAIYNYASPTAYVGPANDIQMQFQVQPAFSSPEQDSGPFSSMRAGQRNGVQIAAQTAGNPSLGTLPTVTRSKITGNGCDASAATMPCFDLGNTYAAAATGTVATVSGVSVVTFSSGISAGARPFVPGQQVTCSGCTAQVITAVSLPPTESTVAGAGQVGQSFNITLSGLLGVTGSKAITAGCSGSAGVGSNCINIGFDINTGGTYAGAPASLSTCGVNNLVGSNNNATNFTPPFMLTGGVLIAFPRPNGTCVPTGVGAYVWGFRIGTATVTDATTAISSGVFQTTGSAWGDGLDWGRKNGSIIQNEAYTCHIVAAKIVQCVLGPQRNIPTPDDTGYATSASNGLFSSIGQWPTDGTYVAYGDNMVAGYANGMQGNAGGQSFPFTAGSGYTVPVVGNATSSSGFTTLGAICPTLGVDFTSQVITMGVAINGGAITDVYPTQTGNGTFGQCSFPLSYQVYGTLSGAGTNTRTLTIDSQAITVSSTLSASLSQTVSMSGAGVGNLTVGSQVYFVNNGGSTAGGAQLFPLIVTACQVTCGTAGNYTVQNLNPGGTGTTNLSNWITAITNSGSSPPALTGPIAEGQMILPAVGSSLPAGSYISLAFTANFNGYAGNGTGVLHPGVYTVTCPSGCGANGSAQLFNVGLQGGTGGAITDVPFVPAAGLGGIATIDSSNNLTGNFVCDNSGAVPGNPLWGAFNFGYSNGTAASGLLTDPGLCAKPFGSHRGLAVSGAESVTSCSPGALQFNLACNGIFFINRRE